MVLCEKVPTSVMNPLAVSTSVLPPAVSRREQASRLVASRANVTVRKGVTQPNGE